MQRIATFVFAAIVLAATPAPAPAQSGDTTITVRYRNSSVRVQPSYLESYSDIQTRMVLHSDSKINDQSSSTGARGTQVASVSSLGGNDSAVTYKVVGPSKIERILNSRNYVQTMLVSVNGKSCTAQVVNTLKPGQTLYDAYSTQLGVMALYSTLKPVGVSCSIQ